MPRYKMILAFDGTDFAGWQLQLRCRTVQGEVQKALCTLFGVRVLVVGSSRTDSGVHAKGHVSHFDLQEAIDPRQLFYKMSHLLPKDISVISIEEVDKNFHARFNALEKTYHYHIHLSPILPPFERFYTHHIRMPVDVEKMQKAARLFEGEHNFSSFAHKATKGCAKTSPVKNIYRCEIIESLEKDRLLFVITGSGFLHKMVRNIVGTLIDVGRGKIDEDALSLIIDAKDRRKAGKTAPAKGLFLMDVKYPAL